MKLRQKLAVVLAATMIATAMPVVTMAKSDNSLTKGVQYAEKDKYVNSALKIEMKDTTTGTFVFFVNLANAEFNTGAGKISESTPQNATSPAGGTPTFTYSADNESKEMKVTVTGNGGTGFIEVPLNVKLKGGDATVAIDAAGSYVSDMSPVVFAKTSDKKASVTVADAEIIYSDAKAVAKITVEEPFKDTLNKKITFTIRHSDYKFTGNNNVVKVEKGFSLASGKTLADLAAVLTPGTDDGVMTFDPSTAVIKRDGIAPGRLTFEFELKATEKKPSTGNLEIKVAGDDINDATVKVAEVKEYGTSIEMDDKKVVDITAGQSDDITFTIKEVIANTFMTGRDFDVEFEGAFLSPIENPSDKIPSGETKSEVQKIKETIQGKISNDEVAFAVTDLIKDKDDYVVGFTATATPKSGKTGFDTTDQAEIKVEDLTVYTALGTSGDVKVKASGRALGYEGSTTAINIKPAVTVTTEPMTIKVGLKEQKGGKIVIKEADKGVIEQGKWLYIKLDDSDSGLKLKDTDLDKIITVTEGDLVLDLDSADIIESGKKLKVKVKRESTVASTITITDLTVYADRTVPQGSFNIKFGGSAVAKDWTTNDFATTKDLEVKDFVIVGTPNTEDITTNGLKKGTASFVIGATKYVVNGVEVTADAAPYAVNGRTMVPVRFVANALGVDGKDIYAAGKAVTIIAGSKTITLEVGSKVAKLNGAPARTMAVAPVVKNGRVFVPVAEIGALLGVEATWDAATQTATFTNK